jgi:putative membrane protein
LLPILLFWWTVLGDGSFRPQRRGLSMLYIFTTMAHTGALAALLTWSEVIWYPSYIGAGEAFGMEALEDQQLGGLIMWVPGGLAYLIAGLALVAQWLGRPAPQHEGA